MASTLVAEADAVRNTNETGGAELVDIPDPELRKAVESALGKASGEPITRGDMESLQGELAAAGVGNLAGIEYAINLRRLTLDSGAISDLRPLTALRSLTYLWLVGNAVVDVSALGGMAELTALYLGDNAIVDVSPLEGLTALTTLDLGNSWFGDGNAIAEVSALAGLTALTILDLSDNKIAEVAPLAGLTSLTILRLRHNAISDVSPLAGLTSLTDLNLRLNPIADVSPLAGLVALQNLNLSYVQWGASTLGRKGWNGKLDPLAGMTSLLWLELDGNGIAELDPLTSLTSLIGLGLFNNRISDVSPLAGMTALTWLSLGGNPIADVSPLAGMTALTWLDLHGNWISDLSPLARMTALTVLFLNGNEIVDLSPIVANEGLGRGDRITLKGNPLGPRSRETHIPLLLQRGVEVDLDAEFSMIADFGLRDAAEQAMYTFSQLTYELATLPSIDASNRGIEGLTGLEGVGGLTSLFLDRNKIKDIWPLAGLDKLRVLTLSHNVVEDWSPLAGLDTLYFLALDGNSLQELPALPPGLQYLYLADNALSDIAPLADMSYLRELDASGNSVASLEPLAGQHQLQYLHVHDNQVTDISSLNFGPLTELHMANNAVRDISPLLEGEALLMADVRGNPLADNALGVLETLRERRVTVLAGETVPYFPAAGGPREGFVRVVNHGDEAGHAFIEAVDDASVRAGPVRLELGARRAVHFNSADLEDGNAAKGLDGGIGAPTAGDWRLSVISALDVEVLAYVRTEDGFVTAMHDVAAEAMAPFFNPGSNDRQRSILRVVNTEADPGKWTTGGYDDRGSWHPMAGSLLVRPQHALTLTAQELEGAHGLGDGSGKWRLRVRGFPWFAMSLLESPTGHLTNLSTAPAYATPLADGATLHRLPLFPAAGGAREGFARLINRSYTSGEATIWAIDDAGTRSGPVRLTMRPRQAVHFNSMDLEGGNASKGLVGSVGVGEGDWRLEITSALELIALAYARTPDGFLTSLHDVAPRTDDGDLWIPFFNPGDNLNQASRLRLANWGGTPAEATIAGAGDDGLPSGHVRVTIPTHGAREYTAAQLEAGGAGVSGALGDGRGKWRLRVSVGEEVDAMSLLTLPTGQLTNLSTTPRHPAAMHR